MPLASVSGHDIVLPLQGSKYFYQRFDLSGAAEVDLLPAAVASALPFGVIRTRITVIGGGASATLKVNNVPDNVANGKVLKNANLGAAYVSEPHELSMLITQLSAIQTGETSCTLEVEYWSGQA